MLSQLSSNNDENDLHMVDLLYNLCKKNEIEKIGNLLPFIGNINIINKIHNSTGSTCLHVACYYGHKDMVKILLEYGALHSIRNLRHDLTPYEEANTDYIKQLFIEHQNLFSNNDYDYIEWSMIGNDLLEKRREFRQAIDLYKNYNNHHLVSKLLAEVIHFYLNEYLINQNNNIRNSTDEIIRKKIATIEGYFKEAIEKKDYLTYFIKAYTLTNFFYEVLNKDLALYMLEYFDKAKTFSKNYRLVNCLVHIVTLLIHHPNLPQYRYEGICYRGMRITQNDIDQYQLNKHILNRAFLSTSIDYQVAEMFAGVGQQSQMRYTHQDYSPLQYSCICQYLIKQKSTAIDIQTLSTRPEEKEILIIPFTVFKVIAIKKNDLDDTAPSVEIQLEECEDSNDENNQLENSETSLPLDDHVIKQTEEYIKLKERHCLLFGINGLFISAIVGFVIFIIIIVINHEKPAENDGTVPSRILFPSTMFGILISIITIIVLQRKNFRTQTNLILKHMVFFKTITFISYNIIYIFSYIHRQQNTFDYQSRFWSLFLIFNYSISLTAHYTALWLTCILSIIRYIIISKSKHIVTSTYVRILVWIVALSICLLLMISNYLMVKFVRQPINTYYRYLYGENSTETFYFIEITTNTLFQKIHCIILLCLQILPVLIIIVFSVLLILNICRTRQLSEHLDCRYSSVSSSTPSLKDELRTTTIIVLITLITIVAEFLQSWFLIVDGINVFTEITVFTEIKIGTGINKDLVGFYYSLISWQGITSVGSSFITFIIYCLLSKQFRMEMYRLLLLKCFREKFNLKTNTQHLINEISLKQRGTITHTALMSSMEIPILQDV